MGSELDRTEVTIDEQSVDSLHKKLGHIMWDFVGMGREREGLEKAIVEKMVDVTPIRQFATVISNAPANLRVPGQASRPQVAWTAEEANYNKTKATFSGFDIVAKKLTGIVPLTEEFQQDAAAFSVVEQLLTKQLAEEIAYQENIAFLAGDGTSKPRGIRTRKTALPAGQKINFGANVAALNYDAVKKAYRAMPIATVKQKGERLHKVFSKYGLRLI